MSTDRPARIGGEKVTESIEPAVGQPAPLSENLNDSGVFKPAGGTDSNYSEPDRGVGPSRPAGSVGGWLSRFLAVARDLAVDPNFVGELEGETAIDEESALAFQDPLLELSPDQPLGRDGRERDVHAERLLGYLRQS